MEEVVIVMYYCIVFCVLDNGLVVLIVLFVLLSLAKTKVFVNLVGIVTQIKIGPLSPQRNSS